MKKWYTVPALAAVLTIGGATVVEATAPTTPAQEATTEDDDDNGSGEPLAQTLPRARFTSVPGNHMSAVVKPELGEAIADFLAA